MLGAVTSFTELLYLLITTARVTFIYFHLVRALNQLLELSDLDGSHVHIAKCWYEVSMWWLSCVFLLSKREGFLRI